MSRLPRVLHTIVNGVSIAQPKHGGRQGARAGRRAFEKHAPTFSFPSSERFLKRRVGFRPQPPLPFRRGFRARTGDTPGRAVLPLFRRAVNFRVGEMRSPSGVSTLFMLGTYEFFFCNLFIIIILLSRNSRSVRGRVQQNRNGVCKMNL